MPKPQTKVALESAVKKEFDALFKLIGAYSLEQRVSEFGGSSLNRNIRDVLAHVYH